MCAHEHGMNMPVKLPERDPDCVSTGNEYKVHSRSYVRIVLAHRLTQPPPDTVSGYSIAKTLRGNETAPAEREVVRLDYESNSLRRPSRWLRPCRRRRPRLALGQDKRKITLFLNLLRLVRSSCGAISTALRFSASRLRASIKGHAANACVTRKGKRRSSRLRQ